MLDKTSNTFNAELSPRVAIHEREMAVRDAFIRRGAVPAVSIQVGEECHGTLMMVRYEDRKVRNGADIYNWAQVCEMEENLRIGRDEDGLWVIQKGKRKKQRFHDWLIIENFILADSSSKNKPAYTYDATKSCEQLRWLLPAYHHLDGQREEHWRREELVGALSSLSSTSDSEREVIVENLFALDRHDTAAMRLRGFLLSGGVPIEHLDFEEERRGTIVTVRYCSWLDGRGLTGDDRAFSWGLDTNMRVRVDEKGARVRSRGSRKEFRFRERALGVRHFFLEEADSDQTGF